MTLRARKQQHSLYASMEEVGNALVDFRSLLMPSPARPPGLIQRYREELQARHYARRTVATYEQWL